jgi:hypothetical protein
MNRGKRSCQNRQGRWCKVVCDRMPLRLIDCRAILLVSASAVVSGLGQGRAGGEDVGEYFADAVKEEDGCGG